MFLLESSHRGDSNENTQYTIFNIKKKKTLSYPRISSYEIFFTGLKNEFETAIVNEPSVFEPLRLGRVAQSVGHLSCKSEVLGSIPGLAAYFHFSFP